MISGKASLAGVNGAGDALSHSQQGIQGVEPPKKIFRL